MSLNFDQAIAELATLTQNGLRIATPDELRALANQVSSYSEGGTTVLYSGKLADGTESSEVVRAMIANGEDVRAIGRTKAALFLNDERFKQAIADCYKTTITILEKDKNHPANQFLEGVDGLWGDLSQRFAAETTGKVRIIAGEFDIDRILGVREMPELLKGVSDGNITEFAGFTRDQLLEIKNLYPAAAETEMRNAILSRAIAETGYAKPTTGSYANFLHMTDDVFEDLVSTGTAEQHSWVTNTAKSYKMGRATLKLMPKLGVAATLVGGLFVIVLAAEAHASGNPEEAKKILEEYAAESAGSAVASTVAGTLATVAVTLLAAIGLGISAPVAAAAVFVATVVGGFFGGDWGKELLYMFQDHSEEKARDLAQRMLKLVFGEDYSLDTAIPQDLLATKSMNLDSTFSRGQIVENAKNDIAWRYALRELNPFVISEDALYDKHNTDGSLDLYDPETDEGAMSEMYLQDRAAMLTWKLRYDRENKPYFSEYNTNEVSGNWDFIDLSTKISGDPLKLAIDGTGISLSDHQIVFGSKNDDTIEGAGESDHLYGGKGNDTLSGKSGNDYLEGNAGNDSLTGGEGSDQLLGGADNDTLTGGTGNDLLKGGEGSDTYVFHDGDGTDTIIDSGTTDTLIWGGNDSGIGGTPLNGGKAIATGLHAWKSDDDKYGYVMLQESDGSNTLAISRIVNGATSADRILVKNFSDGQLGILLENAPIATLPPTDDTIVLSGEGASYTLANNDTTSHTLIGTSYGDRITSGAGDDQIEGRGGYDILTGGLGNDRLYDNTVVEIDAAITAAKATQINTTLTVMEGGAGDDLAIGGVTNYLFGGGGKDTLIGGGGGDILQGDTFNGGYASLSNGITGVYPTFTYNADKHKYSYHVRVTSAETVNYYAALGYTAIDGGADILIAGGGSDVVFGELGNDYIALGEGNDFGVGGEDADTVLGGDGNDIMFGDFGWDTTAPTGNESPGEMAGYDGLPGQYHGNDVLDGGIGNDYIEGNGLDDIIYGGAGDDRLLGDDKITPGAYHGNDYLDGGNDNDTLEGGGKDDELYGGSGDDKLFGDDEPGILAGEFHGDDYLDGEDGNDYMEGGGKDDELFGGIGNDVLWGDSTTQGLAAEDNGKDYLDGEEDDDQLVGGGNDDALFGGTGKDILRGDGDVTLVAGAAHGKDYLEGGAGDDQMFGDGGNDVMFGGDDNDHMEGDYMMLDGQFHGNDMLDGEKGNDTLIGGGGNDTLVGGEGDDELQGDSEDVAATFHGNDSLDGGAGNDVLAGGGGDDNLHGGDGDDDLWGEDGDDTLDGGAGADYLEGGVGNDIYLNVDTDDVIYDEDEQYQIQFASGISVDDINISSFVYDSVKTLTMRIGENEFIQVSGTQFDGQNSYQFSDGTQLTQHDLLGQRLFDAVDLDGTYGDDTLQGFAGNDVLRGGDGNDVLAGGKGDDSLSGGAGNDTYLFARGDGYDLILGDGSSTDTDIIRFAAGIGQGDVGFLRQANGDLAMRLAGSTDQITVQGWYNNSNNRVARIEFDDGSFLVAGDLDSLTVPPIEGTDQDDVLTGTTYDDTILGHGGNDTFDGGAGNDRLEGGEGVDTYILRYQMGQDLVIDTSDQGNIIKIVEGLEFADLDANRNGNDLLVQIAGTSSGMVLRDYFSMPEAWTVQNRDGDLLDVEQIYAATQIMQQDKVSMMWREYLGKTQDSLIAGYVDQGYKINDDGSLRQDWHKGANAINLVASVYQRTTTTDSYWYYYPDYYNGGTVINTVTDTSTNWNLQSTPYVYDANAQINKVSTINDEAVIYAQVVESYSASQSRAYAEAEWTSGGTINWQSNGGSSGSSVGYLWGTDNDYGSNRVIGYYYNDWTMTRRFADVGGQIVDLLPSGSNPQIADYRPQYVEVLLITYAYQKKIEEIYAGASNNIIYADSQTLVDAGEGDDSIYGAGFAYGGEGNDVLEWGKILVGGAGNDTLLYGEVLVGGEGDDSMDGWAGATRYVIDPGQFGHDVINDSGDSFSQYSNWYYHSIGISADEVNYRSSYGGKWVFDGEGIEVFDTYDQAIGFVSQYGLEYIEDIEYVTSLPELPPILANDYASLQWLYDAGIIEQDSIMFDAGISPDEVIVNRIDDSYINLSWGEGKSINIRMATAADPIGTGIELIKFDDGTQWNTAKLEQLATHSSISGTEGNDHLDGSAVDDVIEGMGGDDSISGLDGNDMLSGGAGNDLLNGGLGDDTYLFHAGDGIDTIIDDGGVDMIEFGEGITQDSLKLGIGSLLVRVGADGDAIHIEGFDPGNALGTPVIENFTFADGTSLTYEQLLARGFDIVGSGSISGTSVTDRIASGTSDDAITGGTGNDILSGSAGNDTYLFNLGDGADTLHDHAIVGEGNRIVFGAGIAREDLRFERSDAGLTIRYSDNDTIMLAGFTLFGTDVNIVAASIEFADGATASLAELVDQAPVVSSVLAAQAIDEDALFQFEIPANAFTDADQGDALVLSVTQADGSALPAWLQFDAVTRTFTGTPLNADVGSMTVNVVATDLWGKTAEQTFDLAVRNINDAPIVSSAIADQAALEDEPFNYVLPANAFTDIDTGDTLALTATLANGDPLPAWLSFDAATQTFTGRPGEDDLGNLSVQVTATDTGGLTVASTFNLTVTIAPDRTLLGTGNVDMLVGASGNDTLNGAGGADLLIGKRGNDTYTLDNTGDVIIEKMGEGIDTVRSSIDWTLGVNLEHLMLTGNARNGTGNELDNVLTGNAGNNTLDGSAGADTLIGGAGDDTYFIDQIGDSVQEEAGEGIDTVIASIDVTLSTNAENLILMGAATQGIGNALSNVMTGNALDNTLWGDAGDDWLDGGTGADTMIGGDGNDTYIVDQVDDQVIETLYGGNDTVRASTSHVLGSGIDNLVLTGKGNLNGTGNAFGNLLSGNSGSNLLDGGTGADILAGNAGDDLYFVDDTGDRVIEQADEGTDTVQSSVSYALSDQVEHLVLTGANHLSATGNALDNALTGNAGDNLLDGGEGNDILTGGMGNDDMHGGLGDDTYVYHLGDGLDRITDAAGMNTVSFGAGLTLDNVALRIATVNGEQIAQMRILGADGSEQADQGIDFAVTIDANGQIVSPIGHFAFDNGQQLVLNDLLIKQVSVSGSNKGDLVTGSRNDDTLYGGNGGDTLDGGTGHDTLDGDNGADLVYGGGGNDTVDAGNDSDYVNAGSGADQIWAGNGNDVVQAGSGNDVIDTGNGNDLIDTGDEDDIISAGNGRDWIAGGRGNDTLDAGSDRNLFAFNRGDGADIVSSSQHAKDTISIGKGIRYADLTLAKTGNDLVLGVGEDESITLKDWYAGSSQQGVGRLQVVTATEGGDYDASSSDKMKNRKVELYDFDKLVQRFDAVRNATPVLSQWAVMNGLLEAHLSGSDTAAIGADLSYQYAVHGSLGGIGLGAAQELLSSGNFNSTTPQMLRPRAQLEQGLVRLE